MQLSHKNCLPFENLLLLVRVMGPVVTNVVPNVPGQMVRLILHQADGSQHGHDQFLVLLLQTLYTEHKNNEKHCQNCCLRTQETTIRKKRKKRLKRSKEGSWAFAFFLYSPPVIFFF